MKLGSLRRRSAEHGQAPSGAEALLRGLRAMGVERIFASPGSDWAPVWEALAAPHADRDFPQYVSSRHEETAVAMAMGYAKATGKLPAVLPAHDGRLAARDHDRAGGAARAHPDGRAGRRIDRLRRAARAEGRPAMAPRCSPTPAAPRG